MSYKLLAVVLLLIQPMVGHLRGQAKSAQSAEGSAQEKKKPAFEPYQQSPPAPAPAEVPVPGPPPKPQVGEASSPEELAEFNAMKASVDANQKKQLIDGFLAKYPESGLKALAHQEGALLGQQMNDFEMLADHGEKSLSIIPDNLALLSQLSNAYAERNMPDRAEELANRAIDLANTGEKPPQVTPEQWENGKLIALAANYSVLGSVQLRRAQSHSDAAQRKAEAEKAIAPFKKALEIQPLDDISLWRIGFSYALLNDYDNAELNLAKAVAINGVASSFARENLEQVYKGEKGSLDGLDKIIEKAKAELTLP